MHDLNEALEELRSCLPYSKDTSARKMSKINTLLLACNWWVFGEASIQSILFNFIITHLSTCFY
ncbi:unnamed protein product [Nippostrongylus brasiliensis]|uniref:BHLH domain-containing protein n=1 Tax=Nippostrongylus brasiliensis TaxID=27835 RepID=A0A0N4Y0F5_NIPBR|nr:unnamed protein product [Nippostrongylus brasiliensis]